MVGKYKILTINPGSTSTKIAVFENEELLYEKTLRHSSEEISKYAKIADQFEFRKGVIEEALKEANIKLEDLNAIVGRGGLLKPIQGGTYNVSDAMVEDLKVGVLGEHASNLGGIIAIVFALFANLPNPFTTIQLLFINLVTDSLPAIALGLEKPEKGVMNMPVRDSKESILDKETLKTIGIRGSIIGIVTIIAQYIGMKSSPELGCAMAFLTLTLSRILQTFPSRSNTESIFKLGFTSNKYALGAVGICLVMLFTTLLPFM